MARLTAVAYARYSSDKQQESSIVVQLAAIRRFCEMHDIELIHEYVDEAQMQCLWLCGLRWGKA